MKRENSTSDKESNLLQLFAFPIQTETPNFPVSLYSLSCIKIMESRQKYIEIFSHNRFRE